MKIAFVTHKYGGVTGGVERVVEEMAKRLCQEHEVHVFAQSIIDGEDSSIHFHRIPRFGLSWSLNQALFFLLSHLYLAGRRYDIVHLHAPALYRKGIVTCHGLPQSGLLTLRKMDRELRKEVPFKQIRRFIIMRSIIEYNFKRGRHRRVIALSSMIREDLVSICKTPMDNISLVPNGVDIERFMTVSRLKARQQIERRFGLSPDNFIFLFVGNFFRRKGVQFLLPAFARLRDKSARLMIVGNHQGQNEWAKEMAEELRVGERVIFAGEQKDVETFYAGSDGFVFPSFYESFGLVLLEAMASGLPVITGPTGGAEDFIQDDEDGLLLSSPENTDELALKMESLLKNRALGKRMGERAKAKVMSYSWDRVVEETMAVYRQVIENGECQRV